MAIAIEHGHLASCPIKHGDFPYLNVDQRVNEVITCAAMDQQLKSRRRKQKVISLAVQDLSPEVVTCIQKRRTSGQHAFCVSGLNEKMAKMELEKKASAPGELRRKGGSTCPTGCS